MATIQELLEQRAGGVGQARSDVNFLLKQIQQRMRTAQEQDRQRAKNIKSAGKTGLDAIKTRRDFLLAKRGNPNLSFKDFLTDSRTSGKFMEQGVNRVVSGESPRLTMSETLNPFSRNYAKDLNVERAENAEMLQNLRRGTAPSAEASMLPNQPLGEMPGFDDFSNLPSPPPPAMGDVSGEGLSALLRRGQTPIVPEVTTQYASPSQVASMTKANPIQMEAVDAIQSPLGGIRRASDGLGNIESVPMPDSPFGQAKQTIDGQNIEGVNMVRERLNRMLDGSLSTSPSGAGASPMQTPSLDSGALEQTSKLGSLGRVAGGIGSAASLTSGLRDIARGRGDLSAVARTAGGGVGLATALGVLNPAFGLASLGLGALSSLSRRR